MNLRDDFVADYHGAPFELFGRAHLLSLALLAALAIALISIRGSHHLTRRRVRVGLALSLAVAELSWHWWSLEYARWTLDANLPLHLCTALIWLSVYALLSLDVVAYEFVYFLGIGGPLQGILTPDAGAYGLPHFRAVQTMASHGLIIITALYLTFVEGLRPRPGSVRRVVTGAVVYMALVTVVNVAVGSNYMFTLHKPPTASLLDALGPWPFYLVPMIGIGMLNCIILYVPFAILDRRSPSSS